MEGAGGGRLLVGGGGTQADVSTVRAVAPPSSGMEAVISQRGACARS